MKSVLFISPTGTLDNGAEISIVNFMENLIKRNYNVINIAPQVHHQSQIEYYDYCTLLGIKTLFIPVLKWWWEDAPGGLPGTLLSRSESYKENIRYIRKIIRDYDVDVVITNTVNMFQGAVASSCEDVKHLWLIHEFSENEFKYYNDKIPFISDFSDAIFAVQGNLQNCLEREFYPKEIFSFVPYTKNINKILTDGKVTRFISIGMVTKRKNQLELLKAYRRLDEQHVELIFIGSHEESYYQECLDYVRANSLENVSFTGYAEDPWSIVSNKDICIFTSAMETFGLVYVESILNAVPTILSDNPGHMSAYNILEKGEVYQLGNLEQLVSRMKFYLSNFQTLKNDYLNSKESINKTYNIDISYFDIEKEIKNSIEKPHTLSYIQNIICNEKPEGKVQAMHRKVLNIVQKVKLKFFN